MFGAAEAFAQSQVERPAPLEVLVTAAEAYPRLEALFMTATDEIRLGFRLFDPSTPLLSEAARAIGATWADVMVHTLDRGVPIDFTVSDFDPIMGYQLHRNAARYVAAAQALNGCTRAGAARITARAILHPARGGIAPRLLFGPALRARLRTIAATMNETGDPAAELRTAPGLAGLLYFGDGLVRLRGGVLPQLCPVTLHHKMAVFDRAITYIGGLDLDERRVDDTDHDMPAQDTWYDVQVVSHDPDVARDADRYLVTLGDVIDGKAAAPAAPSAFRMTLSRKRRRGALHLSPQTVRDTVLGEHIARIRAAEQLIYLETQFFRDRRIVAELVQAGHRSPDLRLIVMLPGAPDDAAFVRTPGLDVRFGEYLQARGLRHVRRVFGPRFIAVSPVQPRTPDARDIDTARATLAGGPIVYIHSKVSIFDDVAAIVSSANLNGRSMKWDAEAGLVLTDPTEVSRLRHRIFGHWLGQAGDVTGRAAFDMWVRLATSNAALPPAQRQGFVVPHDIRAAERIAVPVPGAPEDIV